MSQTEQENTFHPNSSSIPNVLMTSVLSRWKHPMIDHLPEDGNEDGWINGFVIRDSFAGEWEVRITKIK